MRVLTNISDLENPHPEVLEIVRTAPDFGARFGAALDDLRSVDAAILSLPSKPEALACVVARLRNPRLRIYYYDVNLPALSSSPLGRLKRGAYLALVRRANAILTLHADTQEYSESLRMETERLVFIGFKSNSWEDKAAKARGRSSLDQGTRVVACGRSYRDYDTFARACAITGLPSTILLPPGSGMEEHGSVAPAGDLPDNLKVTVHDGSRASWIETILGAKIVVVPLRSDVLQPAGVSVYLESMDLGRPVIVSRGPSTLKMLADDTAGIVPPGDSQALASEMLRLWNDDRLRHDRMVAGMAYADRMAGMTRVSRDVFDFVLKDMHLKS